jgi:hypothetical protein
MNTFKKIQEGDKLYLCVQTHDNVGNINITYRLCKDNEEFLKLQNDLVSSISNKIKEIENNLNQLPIVLENLKSELESIKSI